MYTRPCYSVQLSPDNGDFTFFLSLRRLQTLRVLFNANTISPFPFAIIINPYTQQPASLRREHSLANLLFIIIYLNSERNFYYLPLFDSTPPQVNISLTTTTAITDLDIFDFETKATDARDRSQQLLGVGGEGWDIKGETISRENVIARKMMMFKSRVSKAISVSNFIALANNSRRSSKLIRVLMWLMNSTFQKRGGKVLLIIQGNITASGKVNV